MQQQVKQLLNPIGQMGALSGERPRCHHEDIQVEIPAVCHEGLDFRCQAELRHIFKLSIPIFFANLVIPFVAIVDTGLMGNLDNASYLVATSIAASVFSILFGSFGFLRSGTVGMVAQADGSNDYQEVVNIFLRNIAFVIIISLLLILLQNYIFQILSLIHI